MRTTITGIATSTAVRTVRAPSGSDVWPTNPPSEPKSCQRPPAGRIFEVIGRQTHQPLLRCPPAISDSLPVSIRNGLGSDVETTPDFLDGSRSRTSHLLAGRTLEHHAPRESCHNLRKCTTRRFGPVAPEQAGLSIASPCPESSSEGRLDCTLETSRDPPHDLLEPRLKIHIPECADNIAPSLHVSDEDARQQ